MVLYTIDSKQMSVNSIKTLNSKTILDPVDESPIRLLVTNCVSHSDAPLVYLTTVKKIHRPSER
jgi:hypothetical protein